MLKQQLFLHAIYFVCPTFYGGRFGSEKLWQFSKVSLTKQCNSSLCCTFAIYDKPALVIIRAFGQNSHISQVSQNNQQLLYSEKISHEINIEYT